MSDQPNAVDSTTDSVASSNSVAPPNQAGDQQGSTPAPVDPTASGQDKPEGDTPDKQSRRDSRAFATLRRENRELYRRLGGLEVMLESVRTPQSQPTENGEQAPPQTRPTPNNAAHAERDAAAARMVMDRLEDAGDEIEGFDKVISTITSNSFPISTVMRDYLGASDKPAEMAVWLAENPDEAHRISLQSDVVAHRSLERAESRLKGKPAPRASNAPPPVSPVGGRSVASFNPNEASMEEYAAHWKKRNT